MNYHIGCGYTVGKSWLNYDSSLIALIDQIPLLNKFFRLNKIKFPKGIKYGNILKNKLCEENAAENIFCSHVLEHVTYEESKKILNNIYYMLKVGGNFRIVVPSLEVRINEYLEKNDANLFMESLGCVEKNENLNLTKKLRFLFGNSRHKWMYDEKSLYNLLKNQGFKNIRSCEFGDSGIDVFSEVERKDRFIENNEKYRAVAFHCTK